MSNKKSVAIVIGVFLFGILISGLFALIPVCLFWWLWNNVLADILHISRIGFWAAVVIWIVLSMIFGGRK